MTDGEMDIFLSELEERGIEVAEHPCRRDLSGQKCRTCVLGVLLSENGRDIERYMLSWLTKKYRVFAVRQPQPGALFEYPALRFAQLYSIRHGEPVLYLHTKGAAHKGRFQRKNVNMWKHEIVRKKACYERHIGEYDILQPYSGPQNITWMNGFIATEKAFAAIPPIAVLENRFIYEILFKGSALTSYGRRMTDIVRTDPKDNTNLMYRDINHFSSSFSSLSDYSVRSILSDFIHRFRHKA